mmetsp:Transcript_21954/g.39151  ORF Transcript_21954/g.39151 Transcript_21954/m.39151 type:complete len:215 (+) Transcript_21954:371-1015(+)
MITPNMKSIKHGTSVRITIKWYSWHGKRPKRQNNERRNWKKLPDNGKRKNFLVATTTTKVTRMIPNIRNDRNPFRNDRIVPRVDTIIVVAIVVIILVIMIITMVARIITKTTRKMVMPRRTTARETKRAAARARKKKRNPSNTVASKLGRPAVLPKSNCSRNLRLNWYGTNNLGNGTPACLIPMRSGRSTWQCRRQPPPRLWNEAGRTPPLWIV